MGIEASLALHCTVNPKSIFARTRLHRQLSVQHLVECVHAGPAYRQRRSHGSARVRLRAVAAAEQAARRPGPLRFGQRPGHPGRGSTTGTFLGWALGTILGLYLLATTFAPIAALALASVVSELTPLIAPWHLLTLGNWQTIAHGTFAHSILDTVEMALVGGLVTTLVVALATAVAQRSGFKLRRSLPFMLLFPEPSPGSSSGSGSSGHSCWLTRQEVHSATASGGSCWRSAFARSHWLIS